MATEMSPSTCDHLDAGFYRLSNQHFNTAKRLTDVFSWASVGADVCSIFVINGTKTANTTADNSFLAAGLNIGLISS